MAEDKIVIKQNGRIVPLRDLIAEEEAIIIHQRGKEVRKTNKPLYIDPKEIVIVQNQRARFGHPDKVREWNAANAKKKSVPADIKINPEADFDNDLYAQRMVQLEEATNDELVKALGRKDALPAEDVKAITDTLAKRGKGESTGPGEEFSEELYNGAKEEYNNLKEKDLKRAFANKNNLLREEKKALEEVILEKGYKF